MSEKKARAKRREIRRSLKASDLKDFVEGLEDKIRSLTKKVATLTPEEGKDQKEKSEKKELATAPSAVQEGTGAPAMLSEE